MTYKLDIDKILNSPEHKPSLDADMQAMRGHSGSTMVAFSMGTKDMFRDYARGFESPLLEQVRAWQEVEPVLRSMNGLVTLWTDAFDDDPRDLWHIPEAKALIVAWARCAQVLRCQRLLPSARALLLAMGVDPDADVSLYRHDHTKD